MKNHIKNITEDDIKSWGYDILSTLLTDWTKTKISESGEILERHYIIWATQDYQHLGEGYSFSDEILPESISGMRNMLVLPRRLKNSEEQRNRSINMAEVFTPSWVCNVQNNVIDEQWFGRPNVFNIPSEDSKTWIASSRIIDFPKNKTWKKYVRSIRLEMACGEAPYLFSRYDSTTGEFFEPDSNLRIGMFDRKMRLVSENAIEQPSQPTAQWLNWALIALKSVYGFEYQGDSLYLARRELLMSYIDYYRARWNREPDRPMLKNIAEIISWNLWQMDGFTYKIPNQGETDSPLCKIKEWDLRYRSEGGETVLFVDQIRPLNTKKR